MKTTANASPAGVLAVVGAEPRGWKPSLQAASRRLRIPWVPTPAWGGRGGGRSIFGFTKMGRRQTTNNRPG
eukprot:11066890-Alexandrium_andersonii.AAC.1